MAHTGETIENPVTGEHIVFKATAADTNGELLAIDLTLPPDGHVPGTHVHPFQEEKFIVTAGRMRFRNGMKVVYAEAGETVTVPAGRIHNFANAGDEPSVCRVEVRPALKMAELLETNAQLAREGRTTSKGMPKPLDLALFTRRFEDEVQAPFPPAPVVRVLMAPLRALARRRDRAERYDGRAPMPTAA